MHGPKERLILGERISLANTLINTRSGTVTIGDGVIFGHNVMILTGFHNMLARGDVMRRKTLVDAQRDVEIGQGAWIGSGVIIIGPVKIGSNAVIGSGSVVVKDIPQNVLAVGNPAAPVKTIEYHF